jgi:hypothetical protein
MMWSCAGAFRLPQITSPNVGHDSGHAGARRVIAVVVVAACARFPPVRRVGLGPDYRGSVEFG